MTIPTTAVKIQDASSGQGADNVVELHNISGSIIYIAFGASASAVTASTGKALLPGDSIWLSGNLALSTVWGIAEADADLRRTVI